MKPSPSIAFIGGAIGPAELLLVFVVALILFGPQRLPDIARRIGMLLARLRRASDDFRCEVMRMDLPDVRDIVSDPEKDPESSAAEQADEPSRAAGTGERNGHDPARSVES